MNLELAGVAERLAQEFSDLPSQVVIDAVCSCAGECAAAGPFFIEQAARARLCGCRPVATADARPPSAPVPSTGMAATPAAVLPLQPGPDTVADAH